MATRFFQPEKVHVRKRKPPEEPLNDGTFSLRIVSQKAQVSLSMLRKCKAAGSCRQVPGSYLPLPGSYLPLPAAVLALKEPGKEIFIFD